MKENDWLTANKLLKQNEQTKIFLEPDVLNLYSIIVRKVDFQSGERFLQRLPYVSLPQNLTHTLRKQTLKLAERCHYYFLDTAIPYSIKKWQQKIIDYTENQHRLPFPLFRLSDSWQEVLAQEFIPFQSARGEHFHLPTRLTEDLAYFLGVVIGDGHLNYHNIELVDYSQDHMLMLQELANKLFGIEGVISGEKKVWLLHLNNKWLVRLANFLTDQPITGKKYPALREPLIFQSDERLRWAFWSGVLDADGCYKKQVSFCSSSEFFVNEFTRLLNQYNIKYRFVTLKSDLGIGYSITVKSLSKKILSQHLYPRHPLKKLDFRDYLSQTIYHSIKPKIRYSIHNFNPKSLLFINNESFFNLFLLSTLHVVGCAKVLRSVRKHWSWTQQDLADYLEIPKGRLASYEYSDAFPLPLLNKLLPKISNAPENVLLFLKSHKLDVFRSRKTTARLDLQPNETLLSIAKKITIRSKYLLIHPNKDEDFSHKVSNYFNIEITPNNQIQNAVLYLYFKNFFQTTKIL